MSIQVRPMHDQYDYLRGLNKVTAQVIIIDIVQTTTDHQPEFQKPFIWTTSNMTNYRADPRTLSKVNLLIPMNTVYYLCLLKGHANTGASVVTK